MNGSGFRVESLGSTVESLELRVCDLEFRVYDMCFRAEDAVFWVLLRFAILKYFPRRTFKLRTLNPEPLTLSINPES